MKLFCKVSFYILVLVGIALLVLPISWFPAFYDVRYMGIAAIVSALAIIAVPFYLHVPQSEPGAMQKNYAVDTFQFFLTLAVMSNALGDLGLYQLYKVGFEFDKVIHFLNPFLAVLVVSYLLEYRFGKLRNYAIAMTVMIVLLSGIVWELFEFTADQVLGTRIYGINGLNVNADTTFDLMFDTLGAISGAVLAYATSLIKQDAPVEGTVMHGREVSRG
jgi:hypothetical protein